MTSPAPQSYATHRRFLFGFHGVTFAILLANVIWWSVRAFRDFSWERVMLLFLSVGVALLFLYTRTFASGNQDRIIRLEERLRLARVLPGELKGRVDEFTTDQLVALRFASDQELPELAGRVLRDGMTDREAIKQMVVSWRPDHQRV